MVRIYDVKMGARGSQDLRSQSPIMAPAWSKHTSKYSRRKRGRGSDHVAKKREEEGYGTAASPDKEACFQQAAQFNFLNSKN